MGLTPIGEDQILEDRDVMVATENVNKILDSRLVQVFGGRLKDWSDELQKRPETIVAISRKGPRLLELMVREGFLSESVLSRVIAEQALPFLTQNDNVGFVVIDDVLTYGTTFSNIIELTKAAQVRCSGDCHKVTGIPFAVGQKANPKHRKLATKYFLDLAQDQIVPLINNEMLAFRLLGKPYDIEHPMLTWTGDFTDAFKLEAALDHLTEMLGGQKTEIDTLVPTSTGCVPIRRWTILLPTNSHQNFYPHADFSKLRVYLNPEKDRLLVVAMRPLSLSKSDMDSFGKILPEPLNYLWNEVAEKVDPKADEEMAKAGSFSLAMWANFLFATVVLRDIKTILLESFETTMLQPRMFGPRREDLKYLIGSDLCLQAESSLAQFLESEDSTPVSYPLFDHSAEIKNESYPLSYAENYKTKLLSLIGEALDVNDVLQTIFYTQHADIEIMTRNINIDDDDSKRLEFGITYSRLRQMVIERFPDTTEIDIHECFDKLIDNGAIVPKYLNMASSDNSVIWVRTFRVGEGSVKDKGQTIRLLFEKLSAALGKPEIPALAFEKFCALALCVATDSNDLKSLRSLGISKLFHLYGARTALRQGKKTDFLTEWAVGRNILSRSKSVGFSEENGNYSLHKDIDASYPQHECTWDEDVKDGLEDLAALVVAIYENFKGSTLVALTSTASEQELQRALEAELQLWLSDYVTSVNHGLTKLSLLAETMTIRPPSHEELESVNNVLYKMANFTAQVNIKHTLAKDRQNIYDKIDKLADTDKNMKRCWRKLSTTLKGRINSEANSPGLQEITSTLRIVHVTTRILRELLTLAGFKDERSMGLEKSLDLLQATFDDPKKVDPITRIIFEATDSKPDIKTLITIAKSQPLDNFIEAFPEIRKLVLEIADRCEQVLKTYGIDKENERSEVLPPPHYIMMWDIKDSTDEQNRNKIEALVVNANRLIKDTLGNRILGFNANSKDDGNSLACGKFEDVLKVFNILNEVFRDKPFRAGCEVNMQGDLKYYPESGSLGGRVFEYAARIRDFYKEVKNEPTRWSGDPIPSEPATSYMIVSEFAKRYAQQENTWQTSKTHIAKELFGTYEIRIKNSLPVSLTILQPVTFKPKDLEATETHGKQQELI